MKTKHFSLLLSVSLIMLACGNTNNSSNSNSNDPILEEPEEEWEDCDNCNGRGYFTYKCSSCDGKGRLTESYSETSTRTCNACYGTGIAPCNKCRNNGYINMFFMFRSWYE